MISSAIIFAASAVLLWVLATVIWFKRIRQVAIPDNRLPFLLGWFGAALFGLLSFFSSGAGWISGIFGTIAIIAGIAMLVLYVLRKQGAGETIAVGDQIPVFCAQDAESNPFDSISMAGSPILLKFFRGHW
ncbi:MAG: hypothetical protein JKY98_03885 [Gammaproteobacteria bacterium]|nr:hypothetical protein [Gammaproteobacteria bacterium]